jgi:hypothetical protein
MMQDEQLNRHIRCLEIVTTAVSMLFSEGASEQQVRELLQWAATRHWPQNIVATIIQEAERAARAKANSLNGAHS